MDNLNDDIDDHRLFTKGLKKLKPILHELSKIQPPGPISLTSSIEHDFAFATKIPRFNRIVRTILEWVYIENFFFSLFFKCRLPSTYSQEPFDHLPKQG